MSQPALAWFRIETRCFQGKERKEKQPLVKKLEKKRRSESLSSDSTPSLRRTSSSQSLYKPSTPSTGTPPSLRVDLSRFPFFFPEPLSSVTSSATPEHRSSALLRALPLLELLPKDRADFWDDRITDELIEELNSWPDNLSLTQQQVLDALESFESPVLIFKKAIDEGEHSTEFQIKARIFAQIA
ncbi:MAG: hypothetical protein ACO3A2_06755, partial [Bdellovibrionia bacterium]